MANGLVFFSAGTELVTGAVGVGLLKKCPRMLGRAVAEATDTGAGAGVATGSAADVAAFLCDRLLLEGEAAGEAATPAGAGDDSAAPAASVFLWVRRLVGDGEAAADVSAAADGEEPVAGVGEAFAL